MSSINHALGLTLPVALALAPVGLAHAAVSVGETDTRLVLTGDILADESDIELSSSTGSGTLEDAEWDDSYRIGLDIGTQRILSDAGGPLLTTGLSLAYSRYVAEDDGSEFSGNAITLSPRIGVGVHATEWLFLEANAFAGLGLSQFSYEVDDLDLDDDSDGDFAWEYGIFGAASFAFAETFVVGARVGWMSQHIEGTFDGGTLTEEVTVESDSSGMFYGAMIGLRF